MAGNHLHRNRYRILRTSPPAESYSAAQMFLVLVVLALVSGTSFLFYGYEALFKERLRREFERYGMPGVRRWVG